MGESLSEKWVNNKLYGCINVPQIQIIELCYSWLGILCLQWQQATPPERSHHL